MPRRRPLNAARAGACALLALACGPGAPAQQRHAALLRALSTSGEPVAGVRLWADGRELGATSAHGALYTQLAGREGGSVELSAACPPAYRTLDPRRQLVLRRVQRRAGAQALPIELSVRCQPIERTAALIVLASGAAAGGLPLRVDGETLGQIDADGTAHLLLSVAPRSQLRVELDTSQSPRLRPRNPVHNFRLQDEDSILLLEQRFETEPPPRTHRRDPPAARAHGRPRRIE